MAWKWSGELLISAAGAAIAAPVMPAEDYRKMTTLISRLLYND